MGAPPPREEVRVRAVARGRDVFGDDELQGCSQFVLIVRPGFGIS